MQEVLHGLLAEAGQGPIVGHKIGCTTPVMQAYLGIANPCAGGVHATTVHQGHARVRHRDYVRVGVECEIAVRLGADLGRSMIPPVEPEDVARQVVRVLRRRSNEAFVPSYVELISASVRWLPSPARDAITRLLGGHDVVQQADDAARAAYQREAVEQQRAAV